MVERKKEDEDEDEEFVTKKSDAQAKTTTTRAATARASSHSPAYPLLGNLLMLDPRAGCDVVLGEDVFKNNNFLL